MSNSHVIPSEVFQQRAIILSQLRIIGITVNKLTYESIDPNKGQHIINEAQDKMNKAKAKLLLLGYPYESNKNLFD